MHHCCLKLFIHRYNLERRSIILGSNTTPTLLLSLDLGLVLVAERALVVLAVLQMVLGTCSRVVFSVGSLVGLGMI